MEMNKGTSEQTKSLYEKLREMSKGFDIPMLIPTGFREINDMIPPGGFKRGELASIFVYPSPECKSNLMFHTALKLREQNPDLKIVFPVSFEWSEHDERRLHESMRAMGIEFTNPSDQKETKQ